MGTSKTKVLLILIALSIYFFAMGPQKWQGENYLGLSAVLLLLSYQAFKRYGVLIALGFTLASQLGLFVWSYPFSPYMNYGPGGMKLINYTVSSSYAYFITISAFALIAKPKVIQYALHAICVLGMFSAILMCLQALTGNPVYGVMYQRSVDGTFLAMVLPLIMGNIRSKNLKLFTGLVLMTGIVLSKSSTALGLGLIGLTLHLITQVKIPKWTWGALVLFVCTGVLFTSWAGDEWRFDWFLTDNGRFVVWAHSWDFFVTSVNQWTGSGIGSFFVFGPHIQLIDQLSKKMFFFWMHNDWFQILFEMGWPLFIVSLLIFLVGVLKSKRDPALFSSVLVYGLCMLTQMPIRFFFTSLLGACLLSTVYEKERE